MAKFIDPISVISGSGVGAGQTVADLGCGGGFYTVAAAKFVGNTGVVYAVDIQESKLAATQSAGRHLGFNNIVTLQADLEKPLEEIVEGTCDAALVTSILHEVENREALLANAYRVLKTGGTLTIVEWKKEPTPFGPSLERRLAPEDAERLLGSLSFRKTKDIDAGKFHYAILFTK